MTYYDVECVFQSATNLPKDRFVNTFHFVGLSATSPGDSSEMMSAAARVADFYLLVTNTGGAGTGRSVGSYLSSEINRLVTVNVYDHAQAKPRTPFPFHFDLPDLSTAGPGGATPVPGGTQCLPEEVALCASYFSGRSVPRQRGRIYVGPFNLSALGAPGTVTSRPDPGLITVMTAAAKALALVEDGVIDISNPLIDGLFVAGLFGLPGAPDEPSFLSPAISFPTMNRVNWVQHSTVGSGTMPTKHHPEIPVAPHEEFSLVSAGWIDNEWDSQRRRQIDASARTNWIG